MPRSARDSRRVVRTLVVAGAVVLTLGLAVVAALPVVGARAMVVTSGSMEPAIGVGALLVVVPVDEQAVRPGDVITFSGYTSSTLTTHRVLERHVVGGRLHFRTQGDANDTPDVDLAPAAGVVGRGTVAIPHVGRLLFELSRPEVRVAVLVPLALWSVLSQARAVRAELAARRGRRHEPRGSSRYALGAFLAVLLVAAVVAGASWTGVGPTNALLHDAVTVDANTFATGTW